MDCSICISRFGEHRRPLTLPCGHSFCRPCVIQVHRERDYVVCPKCQAHHIGMEVAEFPINYELEDLMESLRGLAVEDSLSLVNNGSGRPRAKDDICPDCRSVIDLWCDNCYDLVCEECTFRMHSNKNHHIIGAKDAVMKLQQCYLDKLEQIDSTLIKNTVVAKELSWAAASLVDKLNETVAEIEEQRTRMMSQKMHIQSGLSLGELSRIVEGSQFDFDIGCPAAMQEIKEAQVMSNSMEMLMKNFQALETRISPSTQVAPSITPVPGPTEVGASNTPVEADPQDPIIATFTGELPCMLKEAPHGSYVNVPEGLSIPYYGFFHLTPTSQDWKFIVAFAANRARYAMFHLDVNFKSRTADLQTTHPVVDNSIEFSSNNFPFHCNEQFILTVREAADKFVVKCNGRFVAFCRKYGQPRSISRCVRVFIEGKGVLLQEFKVLRD